MRLSPYGKSPFFDDFLKKMAGDFLTQRGPEELPEIAEVEAEDELKSEENRLPELLPRLDHALSQMQKAANGEVDPGTLDFGYLSTFLEELRTAITRDQASEHLPEPGPIPAEGAPF